MTCYQSAEMVLNSCTSEQHTLNTRRSVHVLEICTGSVHLPFGSYALAMILRTYLRFLKNAFRKARFLDTFRSRWRENKSATYSVLSKRTEEVPPAPEELQAELERANRGEEG